MSNSNAPPLIPLPTELIKPIDVFFQWIRAEYGAKHKKDFMLCLGFPAYELSRWRKAKWGKKDDLKAQITATEKLLAVLSYRGTHHRYTTKGSPKCVRPDSRWGPYLNVHTSQQSQWATRVVNLIPAVERYLIVLDAARIERARQDQEDAVAMMAAALSSRQSTNFDARQTSSPQTETDLSQNAIATLHATTHAKLDQVLQYVQSLMNQANRFGLTEAALKAIAIRIEAQLQTAPIEDILARIDSFVDSAIREQEAHRRYSNSSPDLIALRNAARAALDKGELNRISSTFDEALERIRIDRAERAQNELREDVQLLELAAEYDRLAFNIEGALQRYTQIASLLFPDDHMEQKLYLAAQHRSQLQFGDSSGDLTAVLLAAHLSRELILRSDRSSSPLAWAVANSALGDALSIQGERELGTETLDEAFLAYSNALEEFTMSVDPVQRGLIQNNIGIILVELAERQADPRLLAEAVAVLRESLSDKTKYCDPLDLARRKHNLALALMRLGIANGDDPLVREAVSLYREALSERTPEKALIQWAKTQDNLAFALEYLERESRGVTHLKAIIALRSELVANLKRDEAPVMWALCQYNLGTTLLSLTARQTEVGDKQFRQNGILAVEAFRDAVQVLTPERWLRRWVTTQRSLAIALSLLACNGGDDVYVKQAIETLSKILSQVPRSTMPLEWDGISTMRAAAESELDRRYASRRR